MPAEQNNSILPNGKVRTNDGQIIDRADAAFSLRAHPKSKNLFFDHKGVCYVRDSKGTMRRFPPKEKNKKGGK